MIRLLFTELHMKTFIATVEVEFTCTDEQMVRDRVIDVPFGDCDLGFRIVSIQEGSLPAGTDECELPDYRSRHGLDQFDNYILRRESD